MGGVLSGEIGGLGLGEEVYEGFGFGRELVLMVGGSRPLYFAGL